MESEPTRRSVRQCRPPSPTPQRFGARVSDLQTATGGSGFTLIELLVVIAIIAILAGMLLPSLAAARRAGQGAVTINNMRQIVVAATLYADDNLDRFPATMVPGPDGLPTTVNFWDVQGYQNALNRYIGGMQGGVDSQGRERSKRNVWFDPADPDRRVPAMWGSFSDNGLVTGIGARASEFLKPANTVYATLRHGEWDKVVGVRIPDPLPVGDPGHAFWFSEYFDMCFDPWSDAADPEDPYFWRRGRAAPPVELFPGARGASEWAQQIEGRKPGVALNGKGRYGKGGYYSFCDGSVRYLRFEATYRSPEDNLWSLR
ncbi:MAG: type II secretion system protein [Verrucomicrobiae bacterium]|nr:type II secretion system protein [Verrucomicrobiae bacterium]